MKLWEILVPTMIDRGKGLRPVKTRCHREWDERVRRITGGLTVLAPVKGQWVNFDNELFKERMIPVRIGCSSFDINKIVQMTMDFYCQEAILYYKISDEVYIIHKGDKKDATNVY